MEENNNFEVDFYKLNLQPDDILILKADISGLTEEQARDKLEFIRSDEFVKYVESKGNKVIVSYSGIDFSILRTNETDKVIAYLDVTPLDENDEKRYANKFIENVGHVFGDKLICVPVRDGFPKLGVLSETGEKE
jgi:hypothetical protein